MSNPTSKPASPGETQPPDVAAAFLSYLVPGLGQIYQGRVGKGLLFLVCLYGLFFYGMYLGNWSNVYLPDTADRDNRWGLWRPLANVYNRLQFAGQFWIGAAAWPAIWQYYMGAEGPEPTTAFGDFQRTLPEERLNALQRDAGKRWDLGWVYTVVAGVLNILVIYDALAGPTFHTEKKTAPARPEGVPST